MIKVFKYLHREQKKIDNRGLFRLTTKVEKNPVAGSESQTNADQTSGAGFTARVIKHGNLAKGVSAPGKRRGGVWVRNLPCYRRGRAGNFSSPCYTGWTSKAVALWLYNLREKLFLVK